MRRRESNWAELKCELLRARSAPKSREWSLFRLKSTRFLQYISDSSSSIFFFDFGVKKLVVVCTLFPPSFVCRNSFLFWANALLFFGLNLNPCKT